MSIFNNIWSFGGIHVFTFLAVMSLIVFVHEMGHFLVGRWCGVKVDVFSLGIGPELYGFVDKKGTRWRLAWIPLGGYVKFHGDANGASMPDGQPAMAMPEAEKAVTLGGQKVWKRAAIVVAGPVANLLLTLVIFSGIIYHYGQAVQQPRIRTVVAQSPAEAAGFKPGDLVLSIDGRSIASFQDMTRIIIMSADIPLAFEVERDGATVAINATPRAQMEQTASGKERIGRIGLGGSRDPKDVKFETYGLVDSVRLGATETWFWVENTGTTLKQLFTGRVSADQVSGPLGIGQILGDVAKDTPDRLISIIAILSLSIGLFNLLPIPLLDGGHLMFYAYEALRGRPMSDKVQEIGFRVGLAMVATLMIFVVSNDSVKLLRNMGWF